MANTHHQLPMDLENGRNSAAIKQVTTKYAERMRQALFRREAIIMAAKAM